MAQKLNGKPIIFNLSMRQQKTAVHHSYTHTHTLTHDHSRTQCHLVFTHTLDRTNQQKCHETKHNNFHTSQLTTRLQTK